MKWLTALTMADCEAINPVKTGNFQYARGFFYHVPMPVWFKFGTSLSRSCFSTNNSIVLSVIGGPGALWWSSAAGVEDSCRGTA
jgi:hypothetical protein